MYGITNYIVDPLDFMALLFHRKLNITIDVPDHKLTSNIIEIQLLFAVLIRGEYRN